MPKKIEDKSLKYHVMVEWPPTCRNRSPSTLKSRPDLVHQINEYTNHVIEVCKTYKNIIRIDQEYNMLGIKTWWQNGQDLYHFLQTQEKNNIRVVPELAVINPVTGRLIMFRFNKKDQDIFVY